LFYNTHHNTVVLPSVVLLSGVVHSLIHSFIHSFSDLLLAVNQEDVSTMSLRDIPGRIEQASRPVTLKLERIVMEVDFVDVVRDPRKVRPAVSLSCCVTCPAVSLSSVLRPVHSPVPL
jgi:hypothetical protein